MYSEFAAMVCWSVSWQRGGVVSTDCVVTVCNINMASFSLGQWGAVGFFKYTDSDHAKCCEEVSAVLLSQCFDLWCCWTF